MSIAKAIFSLNYKTYTISESAQLGLPWLPWQLACPDDHTVGAYQENQWPASNTS